MDSTDLAFFTTTELIAELMKRQTFYGLVIHADGDHKRNIWKGERVFKVHLHTHLNPEGASRLLGVIADHMSESQDQ